MKWSRSILWGLAALVVATIAAAPARASDPEGCLTCHRYRGLARLDDQGQRVRLFGVDPNYYDRALGPHARVPCTGCHERDEVAQVPHKPVRPVDCTRTCHLSEPGKVERSFAHDRVKTMLDGSVHGAKALDQTNQLLGKPLREGQARCLLCHDEPTFRRTGDSGGAGVHWATAEEPISRCSTCHDGQLPVDTRYFYWHVHARSQPARNPDDTIRVCASCHSNPQVKAAFKLPDATVSYLASFHGKAIMLGSKETATCLDCHVNQLSTVHEIRKHDQAAAAVSTQQLPDTCRTPKCHRAAGARLSTAAVHLELATSRGIEYLIACVFVLMILFTFGPSVLINVLEQLQVVIGRHDPEHHHHLELAEKLSADARAAPLLERFNVHQRVQHWLLALTFGTLVLTGFPMKFADRPWAAWVVQLFGGLPNVRWTHRLCGALLLTGMAYHSLYILRTLYRNHRRAGQGGIKGLIASVMGLPMVTSPSDMLKMNQLMMYLCGLRKQRPTFGRFNPEEKFEYFGVFWGVIVLGMTGTLMWANAWASRYVPGRLLTLAALLHTFEAFLALVHVGIVHLIGVTISPGVFPLSPAMLTGKTPPEELAEGHADMLTAAEQTVGGAGHATEPAPATATPEVAHV